MGNPQLPRPVLTPAAFLLDLDGTLYTDAGPIAGGPETIIALRQRGIPFRCVTNTTSCDRAGLVARLRECGYTIGQDEITTPANAALAFCQERGFERVLALVPEAALSDLEGLTHVPPGEGTPQAVILGDLRERWTYALLQQAFEAVMAGAEILALSKDRYFQNAGRLTLDVGPFAAGLEYATGRSATVLGKPSPAFYEAALRHLGANPASVVMVGDDLWSDIQGAQAAGMRGWLVRTGKFRDEALRSSGILPERTLAGIGELGALLRGGGC